MPTKRALAKGGEVVLGTQTSGVRDWPRRLPQHQTYSIAIQTQYMYCTFDVNTPATAGERTPEHRAAAPPLATPWPECFPLTPAPVRYAVYPWIASVTQGLTESVEGVYTGNARSPGTAGQRAAAPGGVDRPPARRGQNSLKKTYSACYDVIFAWFAWLVPPQQGVRLGPGPALVQRHKKRLRHQDLITNDTPTHTRSTPYGAYKSITHA
jgi:hypothetical protein